jgi:hypothetical protein
MADTQDLILAELQALRSDFNFTARNFSERVSTLESGMHGLLGNGQPGRVAVMEAAVTALNQWRWWVIGCAAGSSSFVSIAAWLLLEAKK